MSAPDRDPFALGGGHPEDGDAEALALFQRWLAESRAADATDYSDEDGWDAALARRDQIEKQILACAGPIGLAIKMARSRIAGFKDGEIVIARKVSPDRARMMADRLTLIRKHCLHMENQLREAAAQAMLAVG